MIIQINNNCYINTDHIVSIQRHPHKITHTILYMQGVKDSCEIVIPDASPEQVARSINTMLSGRQSVSKLIL